MRSALAVPDWTAVAMAPSWPSGCENCCEYWMNACTSPSSSAPEATMAPPTTAMATYTMFPMTSMIGIMIPERNWARSAVR